MKKLANKKNGLFKDGSELIEKELKQGEESTTDEEIEELFQEMGKKNGGEGQLGDEEVDPLNFDGFTAEDFRDVADEPGVLN